jgi:hypothetical protein
MAIALQKLADLTKEITGKTPNILVGTQKLYPPKDGQVMSKKAAVAAHEALYGEKGTIVVKDGSRPVFKQTNGSISLDENKLQQKLTPLVESPENLQAKEKYQALLDSHPSVQGFPQMTYDDRLEMPVVDQKMADRWVEDMAIKEELPFEDYVRVLAQGSGFVNSNLDATEGNSISEGLQYLADNDTQYRDRFFSEVVGISDDFTVVSEEPLVAQMDLPIDEIEQIPDQPSEAMSAIDSAIETAKEMGELIDSIDPEIPETALELPDLKEVSQDLTPNQRFAPGTTPDSTEQMIAGLQSQMQALQAEMASVQRTMEKIAQKEPVPKVRAWAKNKLENVVKVCQDRAKVDTVKLADFAKSQAQKAMDYVGKTVDNYQDKMLSVTEVSDNLKTLVHDIHEGAPEVKFGDYTVNNQNGIIDVTEKDRGVIFSVNGDSAGFKGQYNSKDYNALVKLKEVVAVISNPAAAIAEVAKELTLGAAKQEAQKSAVKLS